MTQGWCISGQVVTSPHGVTSEAIFYAAEPQITYSSNSSDEAYWGYAYTQFDNGSSFVNGSYTIFQSDQASCQYIAPTNYDCINGVCTPSTTYGTPGGYPSLATCQAACGAAACPACPSCPTCEVCPSCPTCEVCATCPTCEVCATCPPCEVCPTCPTCEVTTCPTCPAPTVCPSCPTCPPCPLFVPSESEWQSYCSGYGSLCPVFPNCPVCPDASQSCPSCTVGANSDGTCPPGYSQGGASGASGPSCVFDPTSTEEVNFVNISAPTFSGGCDSSGNPVYGSQTVMVIQGTEAAELLKFQELAQIQGAAVCQVDVAAIPDGWLIRPEWHRPQAVYQFAQVDTSGNIIGAPKYKITVPHHIATKPTTGLPNYQRGNWETIFVLNDNSKVTIHSKDAANGNLMLNAIKLLIDPAQLTNAYLSKSCLVVTDTDIAQITVRNRMAKYWSEGTKNELPDWVEKW